MCVKLVPYLLWSLREHSQGKTKNVNKNISMRFCKNIFMVFFKEEALKFWPKQKKLESFLAAFQNSASVASDRFIQTSTHRQFINLQDQKQCPVKALISGCHKYTLQPRNGLLNITFKHKLTVSGGRSCKGKRSFIVISHWVCCTFPKPGTWGCDCWNCI